MKGVSFRLLLEAPGAAADGEPGVSGRFGAELRRVSGAFEALELLGPDLWVCLRWLWVSKPFWDPILVGR